MISVLIPIYNYNVTSLVKELHRQLIVNNVVFEIICFEDGSSTQNVKINSSIQELTYTTHIINELNLGRVQARQKLCIKANYNWLLFLDADVMPKTNQFIKTYLEQLNKSDLAYFGGIDYKNTKPKDNYVLRWKYGTKKEVVHASQRRKTPYKQIVSANMLIDKDIFYTINSKINYFGYGMDNFFGSKLKESNINICHINSEVYHLGIEESITYLKKKEQAADTLLVLIDEKKIDVHDNNLLHVFLTLKKYKLNYFFASIFKTFKNLMRKNLLSANPSIKLLQFYRITYLCSKDLNA